MTNISEAEADKDVKYHFISAIHSLYYVPKLEEVLGFLYEKLAENGILYIAIATGKYNEAIVFKTHTHTHTNKTKQNKTVG